jgi:hypothetical protein
MSATAGNEEITSLEVTVNLDMRSLYQRLKSGLHQGFPSGTVPFPDSSFHTAMCFKHTSSTILKINWATISQSLRF